MPFPNLENIENSGKSILLILVKFTLDLENESRKIPLTEGEGGVLPNAPPSKNSITMQKMR